MAFFNMMVQSPKLKSWNQEGCSGGVNLLRGWSTKGKVQEDVAEIEITDSIVVAGTEIEGAGRCHYPGEVLELDNVAVAIITDNEVAESHIDPAPLTTPVVDEARSINPTPPERAICIT